VAGSVPSSEQPGAEKDKGQSEGLRGKKGEVICNMGQRSFMFALSSRVLVSRVVVGGFLKPKVQRPAKPRARASRSAAKQQQQYFSCTLHRPLIMHHGCKHNYPGGGRLPFVICPFSAFLHQPCPSSPDVGCGFFFHGPSKLKCGLLTPHSLVLLRFGYEIRF